MLNRGAIYWATALGVGVAAGAGAAIWRYGDPFLQSIAPAQLVGAAPAASNNPPPAAPAASSAPKTGGAPGAAPAPQVASKAAPKPAEAPPEEQATPPQFDIVRVEPTGEAVIAGRAAPKAKVSVTDHGRIVAEATADDSGEFTVLPPAFAPGGHSLGLTASVGGGKSLDSPGQVAVDVPQPPVKATSGPKIAAQATSPKQDSNAPSASAPRPYLAQAPAQPVGGAPNAASAPAPSAASTTAAKGQVAVPAAKTLAPSTAVTRNEPPVPAASAPAPVVVARNEAPGAAATAPAAPASSSTVVAKNEAAAPAPAAKSETAPGARAPMAAAKNEAAAPAPGAKSETPPAAPAPTAGIKNEASAPAAVAPAPAPAPAPRVVVGSVAVEDGGRLVATGAASPNALLRLYLNGAFIANVTTGSDGRWSLTVEHGMKGGAYAVRADQIDPAKGSVIARAEVPFDYPERLAEQDAPAERLASTPVAAPPRPPVAATEPSAEAAASTVTSPKPPVAAAEPQAAPSAPAAMSQKPPVMAAEPEAAPSAPLAEAPKLPAAAAASQPAASVAASPKPLETGSEQHPSSTAQTLAPTRPEVAPVPPTAASAQPEVAASADAPSSSSAATPLSPGGAPPQAVAGAHAPGDAANAVIRSVDTKKVVRGDSLWRISSHFYGSGLRYKQIYEANASQIRDPWLIYPGQIFVLPRETPF